jgi:membrane-bound lytic murein transglycosylase A
MRAGRFILLCCALCSCGVVPGSSRAPAPGSELAPVSAAECRSLFQDDASAESLREASLRSLDALQRQPAEGALPALDRQVRVGEVVALLNALVAAGDSPAEWREVVCERFRLYRVIPAGTGADGLLVTGYYQPELRASRVRTERFRYPLYRTPDNLVDVDLGQFCRACAGRVAQGRIADGVLVPYYTRAEIDAGALAGKELEIAWLEDPVEAFFLHVQGSARLRFDDGVVMDVSYSGSNGRAYTSIGRELLEQGKLARDVLSLQTLKDYLRSHPDEQTALMHSNERYIFFRAVPVGPVGSLGVPLTAGRSVAADARLYPAGGVAFLRIAPRGAGDLPETQGMVERLVVIQDTGIAITGPRRIDMYCGTGADAEARAGGMRNAGELYVVLPP